MESNPCRVDSNQIQFCSKNTFGTVILDIQMLQLLGMEIDKVKALYLLLG